MSEASSSPKRPRLDYDENSSKDEQFEKFRNRDQDESSNLQSSKSRKKAEMDEEDGKDDDGKSKLINRETTPREHTLVMRLTNKEQELQECMNQIQEMKQAQTQKTAHLRSMLLDPAINLVFQRMAKEMDEHKEKLKQKQNELSAWKFTPDSQTGMRLMAKCRMLLQENGDLGKMISSGRTARLEGEIALHKALVTEMKKNQKELDEFVGELEEDVEGMQGMIFMLQEQLKEAREQIARLQHENEQLRTLRMPPDPEPGGEGGGVPDGTNGQWGLDPHSTTPQSSMGSSDLKQEGGVCIPPALTALSRTTVGDQHHFAQSSDEDLAQCAGFVSKVTPDSGMLTQEEEEASMDTTDFADSPSTHDPTNSSSQPAPSSRTTVSSDRFNSCHSEAKTEGDTSADTSAGVQRTSGSFHDGHSSASAQKSPGEVDSSHNTVVSYTDSISRSNSSLTQACDGNLDNATPPAICSSNGQADELDSNVGQRTEVPGFVTSGRTNHSDRDSKENHYSGSAGLGKEMKDEDIEDCKQSIQAGIGLTFDAGKLEDPSADSQVKENLVNGQGL